MERGIYKITNPEGKIYIGLSKNIKRRWNDYRCNTSMKGDSLLKDSLKTWRYDNHIFEIRELIQYDTTLTEKENSKILRERERYWINFYESDKKGLNQNRGGCGPGNQSEEAKTKISQALKNKPKPPEFGTNRKKWQHTEEFKSKAKSAPRCPILVFKLNDDFVGEFPNQQKVADFIGAKKNAIWNALNEHPNKNGKPITQVKGFKFKYK